MALFLERKTLREEGWGFNYNKKIVLKLVCMLGATSGSLQMFVFLTQQLHKKDLSCPLTATEKETQSRLQTITQHL